MPSAPLRRPGFPRRLHLVPAREGRPGSALEFWHLLSLDAPTVAAVWVLFVSWCAGVRLSAVDPLAMFVAVWTLYVADRLLDAKPLFASAQGTELRERHHFHHRHRSRFMSAILLAIVVLLPLLHHTADTALHMYALLAALLSGWLLLVHARQGPPANAHDLPKELAVGVFFPAAVFIPTVSSTPALRGALLPHAICFACLCSLNCLFLYSWEHNASPGAAHATTRWALQHLGALAVSLGLAASALAIWATSSLSTPHSPGSASLTHPAAPFSAIALSSGLLLLLHRRRHKLHPLTLRGLADLVLLTPIPVIGESLIRLHR